MNFLVRSVVVRIDVPGGGTAASGGDGTSLNGFNQTESRRVTVAQQLFFLMLFLTLVRPATI